MHRAGKRKVSEEEITKYVGKKAKKIAKMMESRGDRFVWRRKIERELSLGVGFSAKSEREKQRERMEEIEKAKKRREERAAEKAQREEDAAMLARERCRVGWEEKEEEFEFEQSKLRSEIRIRQGRMKPIDHVLMFKQQQHQMSSEPCMVFEGLTVREIEELREDIKLHLDLDRATPADTEYWEALLVVCDWELAEARQKEEPPAGLLVAQERGLHSSIEPDVRSLLERTSFGELEGLLSQVESRMRTGEAKVVEFWEDVIRRLHVYKAKACLKETHARMLMSNEGKLMETETDGEETRQVVCGQPRQMQDPEEGTSETAMKATEAIEEVEPLDTQVQWWQDRYRPRKPKYFNRVHTGFEWNKYNRTHFDLDNPPPKIVQGYKFNIFYPDLVGTGKAPSYTLHEDGSCSETCIIRFHAEPPYEDIAFRIVNKEWDYSRKKGFKCTSERGTLQVYFNFKRFPYRR